MLRRIGPRLAAAITGVLLLVTVTPGAQASARPDPTAAGKHKVAVADYNLGDSAFRIPGFNTFGTDKPAPLELAGRVHYPRDLKNGPYPLVLLAHGLWPTCADRAASDEFDAANKLLYGPNPPEDPQELARLEAVSERTGALLNRWPCAPGTPSLPSLRGYDYLGQQLASHGFVVVSIGVNGVNVGEMGEIQDQARATLANKHLQMWRDLVTRGTGPLAGRFTGTRPSFRGHVDLQRVGLVGHSRGGRGVMSQAADVNAAKVPSGVRIGAVLGLEAVGFYRADDDPQWELPYRVTRIPSATLLGDCGYGSRDYFDASRKHTKKPVYLWNIHGANHNFFNTQWSPDSGQVQAQDDAYVPEPGQCGPEGALDRKLNEPQQRRVGLAYMSAFFRRHLAGDRQFDPMLSGRTHPLSKIATVDAQRD